MKLYSQFSIPSIGRTFPLDVATAEWIWVNIKDIDDVEHIKNEIRAFVLEAQADFDKMHEEDFE